MALEDIELTLTDSPLPADVERLLAESDRRIDHLFATNRNRRVPRFLPSDPALLYRALEFVTREQLAPGDTFCEWGCGFGVAAGLAAILGYRSYGIEIEPDLAEMARELARDHSLQVDILCESYFPDGYQSAEGQGGTDLIKPENYSRYGDSDEIYPAYEGMDHAIDEIDVFYVYPWPGEQELMHELFDAVAADGAILLAYYGQADICAYRKVVDEDWD